MANCVSMMTEMLHFYKLPMSTSMDYVTDKWQTISDWLKPHSLGTMSGYGCIENLV